MRPEALFFVNLMMGSLATRTEMMARSMTKATEEKCLDILRERYRETDDAGVKANLVEIAKRIRELAK